MAIEQLKTKKAYRSLATITTLEINRLDLLKKKIESEQKLMAALVEYYDEQAEIESQNVMFGFDLSLR